MSSWFRVGLLVTVVHGLEDVALLSLGRFLPVPVWAMYAIGLTASVLILTNLLNRLIPKSKIETAE